MKVGLLLAKSADDVIDAVVTGIHPNGTTIDCYVPSLDVDAHCILWSDEVTEGGVFVYTGSEKFGKWRHLHTETQ